MEAIHNICEYTYHRHARTHARTHTHTLFTVLRSKAICICLHLTRIPGFNIAGQKEQYYRCYHYNTTGTDTYCRAVY